MMYDSCKLKTLIDDFGAYDILETFRDICFLKENQTQPENKNKADLWNNLACCLNVILNRNEFMELTGEKNENIHDIEKIKGVRAKIGDLEGTCPGQV